MNAKDGLKEIAHQLEAALLELRDNRESVGLDGDQVHETEHIIVHLCTAITKLAMIVEDLAIPHLEVVP